jgi:glutamine amidotransferase
MGVVIVDYGAGNLRSVARAVQKVGWHPRVTSRPEEVATADALIVPGVGAAADTMRNLNESGLAEPVRTYIASGRPFLGVCMGLQALMTVSEEGGQHPCLDVVAGRVRRLEGAPGLKIPHMGWNTVTQLRPHPIFRGVPNDTYFYFVHSYVVDPEDESVTIGETVYGSPFTAAIARDNLVATQFHPEKSSRYGLQIYANFLSQALGGGAK